jgi:hypothetical protein
VLPIGGGAAWVAVAAGSEFCGSLVAPAVVAVDGTAVGRRVGVADGVGVGLDVGVAVGRGVGVAVGVGVSVGVAVGSGVAVGVSVGGGVSVGCAVRVAAISSAPWVSVASTSASDRPQPVVHARDAMIMPDARKPIHRFIEPPSVSSLHV